MKNLRITPIPIKLQILQWKRVRPMFLSSFDRRRLIVSLGRERLSISISSRTLADNNCCTSLTSAIQVSCVDIFISPALTSPGSISFIYKESKDDTVQSPKVIAHIAPIVVQSGDTAANFSVDALHAGKIFVGVNLTSNSDELKE